MMLMIMMGENQCGAVVGKLEYLSIELKFLEGKTVHSSDYKFG